MQNSQALYTIAHQDKGDHWQITFNIPEPYHTLDAFPQVSDILTQHLPIIMTCDCYNEGDLPFCEEVKHTETGHLFEHILLEYLCQAKLAAGHDRAEFSGNTSWNWVKEKRGRFHITIGKESGDACFFNEALKQSLALLNRILEPDPFSLPVIPTPLSATAHGQTNRPPQAAS
jgi:hypothetical protein